ncbi:hypothetical protein [Ferruginivarius sediminum]|uniref:hypothetical protein n=1 Tax=Ferruginivarius sediminum TaxID=2661937 RepID=UPI001293D914|nr:hypothetical protein [Ferruginivarius sediminum]
MQRTPSPLLPPSPQRAWYAAKKLMLDWWDNPPATLFWLLLTAAAVGTLKAVGF